MLGVSESASGYAKMFRVLDRKQKIFEKKYLASPPALEIGRQFYTTKGMVVTKKAGRAMDMYALKANEVTDAEAMIEKAILGQCAPCGVLINSDMEVISSRGSTGRYLQLASGKPSHDIFKLAREGLLVPLRMAIHEAKKTAHKAKKEGIIVSDNGRKRGVIITVLPEPNPSDKTKPKARKEICYLVLFEETAVVKGASPKPKARGSSVKDGEYLEVLQKELAKQRNICAWSWKIMRLPTRN